MISSLLLLNSHFKKRHVLLRREERKLPTNFFQRKPFESFTPRACLLQRPLPHWAGSLGLKKCEAKGDSLRHTACCKRPARTERTSTTTSTPQLRPKQVACSRQPAKAVTARPAALAWREAAWSPPPAALQRKALRNQEREIRLPRATAALLLAHPVQRCRYF